MKRSSGAGTWPDNCGTCGCPCQVTQNDHKPQHRRVVWAWEMAYLYLSAIESLHAIFDQLRISDSVEGLVGIPDGACEECCCPWWTVNGERVWGYELADERRQQVEALEASFVAAVPDSQRRLALRLEYDPEASRVADWCKNSGMEEFDD